MIGYVAIWWTCAFFFACLLRPTAAFVGHTGLGRLDHFSNRMIQHKSVAAARAAGLRASGTTNVNVRSRRSRWNGRRGVAGGVGELRAAFEVEEVDTVISGCVIVAGADNYGSSTFKAVAVIYEHGEGQPTRAVCIDKGLQFEIGEMTGGELGPLSKNRLFRGGDEGGSVAIMVHTHDIKGSKPMGDTGLFVGGFAAALDLVERNGAQPEDFKFFFNHLAFPKGALEEQVRKGMWKVVKLPNKVVLETKRMRDMELWGRIDFALKKNEKQ